MFTVMHGEERVVTQLCQHITLFYKTLAWFVKIFPFTLLEVYKIMVWNMVYFF
jgi:hypothetical protein